MEWASIAELINRILKLAENAMTLYKQKQREKDIEKIKNNTNKAWSDRFSDKGDDK